MRETVAGTVGSGNHVLELVDRLRREIPRIEDGHHVQARVDRHREIADDATPGPFAAERGDEIGDRLTEPLVGRHRRGLGEQPEPGGAIAARHGGLAQLESARERRLERVAQRSRVGGAVVAQQKRQRVSVDGVVTDDGVDHAIGNPLQVRKRAGVQS